MHTLTQISLIAAGGALGAVARFFSGALALKFFGGHFPIGTLLVNAAGSLLLGVVYVVTVQKGLLPDEFRLFLAVGLLGAYTTFSTFALETVLLSEGASLALAFVNILANVVLSVGALLVGVQLTRSLLAHTT